MKRYILFIIALFTIVSTAVAQTEPDYLYFIPEEDATIFLHNSTLNDASPISPNIQYSFNKKTWNKLSVDQQINVDKNCVVYFKGKNPYGISKMYSYVSFNVQTKDHYVRFACGGNIMTLIDETGTTKVIPNEYCFCKLFWYSYITTAPKLPATSLQQCCYCQMFFNCHWLTTPPELPATSLQPFCYSAMFKGCDRLTTAPTLPATTLADYCYNDMFQECNSLTTAPALPATTLANYCYNGMFSGCTNLMSAPELPATSLTESCYSYMFSSCTSLTVAPSLPATELAGRCYGNMFAGCTSLTDAPKLSATKLAPSCYNSMFSHCTSLVSAPILPATTLEGATSCYSYMFSNCTSLVSAPELPASVLASNCYGDMFSGCTSIVSAPELSATTLDWGCYIEMFRGCTSLTTIPVLPATTLAKNCYQRMFWDCTNLTTANLPAATLAEYCYERMFYGCTKLNKVNVGFTVWKGTAEWLKDVSETGFLFYPDGLTPRYGDSYIPEGWGAIPIDKIDQVYSITAEDEYITITDNKKTAMYYDEISFSVQDRSNDNYRLDKVLVNETEVSVENYKGSIKMYDFLEDISIKTIYSKVYRITTDEYTTADKEFAAEGEKIILSFATKQYYQLLTFFWNGWDMHKSNNPSSITMGTSDIHITTKYAPNNYWVTTDDYVTCKPSPLATYEDKVTFTVADRSSEGLKLDKVVLNKIYELTGNSFDMKDYHRDVVISAVYSQIDYTINTDEYSSVDKTTANYGDEITVTIPNRIGYVTSATYNDNTLTITDNTARFTMPAANVTIATNYTPINYNIITDENIITDKSTATINDKVTFSVADRSSEGLILEKVLINNVVFTGNSFDMKDYLQDVEIKAVYTPISYSVTTYDQYVSVDKSSATINDVVNITIADRTADNYTLNHLLVNGNEINFDGYTAQILMSDYLTDVTIQAEYSYTDPSNTTTYYSVTTDGYCTADKSSVTINDIVNIYIADRTSENYTLTKLLVNGNEISFNGYTAQFSMSDYLSDVTIQAEYTYTEPSNTTYYSVTTDEYCTVDKSSAAEGDVVTVYINQREGYSVNVYYNGAWLTSDYQASFTMPAVAVYIYAEYTEMNSSQYYNVSTDQYSSTDKTQYAQGETVSVTFSKRDGYNLESATINNTALNLNGYSATFKMPSNDVSIVAEYKKIENPVEYTITNTSEYVSVSTPTAKPGDEVSVFVSRRDGYTPHVFVNGAEVLINGNVAKYIQPSASVVITVDYKKDATTAVTEISGNNPAVSVYPNPARQGEKIVISIGGGIDLKNTKILIYNTHGALVKRIDHAAEYNEANLKSGIYNGVLIYKNGRQTFRIAVY